MKLNLIIRKAEPADAAAWINLSNLVWRTAYQHILPENIFTENESQAKIAQAVANFEQTILAENRISYVAEIDQQLIGFFSGVIKSNYEFFGKQNYADLERIYIHPDYQRLGIGKKFFDIFVNELKIQKISKFVIGVFKDNQQARKAYQKWGGVLSSYTQNYCKHGVVIPEVFYTYQI